MYYVKKRGKLLECPTLAMAQAIQEFRGGVVINGDARSEKPTRRVSTAPVPSNPRGLGSLDAGAPCYFSKRPRRKPDPNKRAGKVRNVPVEEYLAR